MLSFAIVAFFLLLLLLAFWTISEQRIFTRVEGKMRRGVFIGSQRLSEEMRRRLEGLEGIIHSRDGFVRKEEGEVLISQEPQKWRRTSWTYLAYVNLSMPESRLEFRMPLSNLVSSIVSLLLFPLILYVILFQEGFASDGATAFFLTAFVFIVLASIGSLLFHHFRERKRIMKIFNDIVEIEGR